MTAEPLSAQADTALGQCAAWMVRHHIRHVPVTDHEGRPIGVLTDDAIFAHGGLSGDALELWVPNKPEDATLEAGAVSAAIQVTVTVDTPSTHTLRQILGSTQDFAVVTGPDGVLAGIVTEHDGVRLAAQVLENQPLHVRDIGSKPVASTTRLEPARDALEHMELTGSRHLVVVDPAGKLVAVLSKSDLLAAGLTPDDPRAVGTLLRDKEPVTVSGAAPLADAAYRMLQHHVGCLPVVDDRNMPVRILTRFDLIAAALDAPA